MKSSIAAVSAIAVLTGIATACSSGGGTSTPPNAQSVLKSDGYTYDSALTSAGQSGIEQSAGFSSSGLSSFAAGSSGSNVQLVIVLTSQPLADIAMQGAQRDLAGTGLTIAQNGDVITVTGPFSAFSNG